MREKITVLKLNEERSLVEFLDFLELINTNAPVAAGKATVKLSTTDSGHGEPALIVSYNRPLTVPETIFGFFSKISERMKEFG